MLCGGGRATSAAAVRSAELTLPGFVHDVCSADPPVRPRVALLPRLRSRSTGSSSSSRRRRSPTRSTTAARSLVERSLDETAAGLGRGRARLPTGSSAAVGLVGRSSSGRSSAPLLAPAAPPGGSAGSALHALRPAAALGARPFATTVPGRSSRAARRTRSCRSSGRRPPPSASFCSPRRTCSAGRCHAAVRSGSRMRSSPS